MSEHSNISNACSFFFFFQFMAILENGKWHLIVFFICLSLMTNNVEHLCMCLLATCVCSLEKMFSSHLFNFFHWAFHIFGVIFFHQVVHLYILWKLDSHQRYDLQIFSSILQVIFSLSWWCSLIHNVFNVNKVQFIYFFVTHTFGSYLRIHCQMQSHKDWQLQFLSETIMAIPLIFRMLIHFDVYDVT